MPLAPSVSVPAHLCPCLPCLHLYLLSSFPGLDVLDDRIGFGLTWHFLQYREAVQKGEPPDNHVYEHAIQRRILEREKDNTETDRVSVDVEATLIQPLQCFGCDERRHES